MVLDRKFICCRRELIVLDRVAVVDAHDVRMIIGFVLSGLRVLIWLIQPERVSCHAVGLESEIDVNLEVVLRVLDFVLQVVGAFILCLEIFLRREDELVSCCVPFNRDEIIVEGGAHGAFGFHIR